MSGQPEQPGRGLFANGGELGRAMAALDWSTTAVGDPDGWPSSLRNAVRIVLTSRFAMWMAYGPELAFFYNDAYERDTLQAKHPWALGRPAHEVWAEIWHDIGPRIQSVLDTGVATWDEDLLLFLERSGYPEETYHTFSYSPLENEGRTEGMLCVVAETTERVLGERRVAHLRDLATVATNRSQRDVLDAVSEQLARDPADLPFCAIYLREDGDGLRLGCTAGVTPGSPVAPERLPADADAPWPVGRVLVGAQALVEDLGGLGELPTGAWQQPPQQAVVLPIRSSPQDEDAVTGALVVGLNPHRRYDDSYRGFLELVANQIASGLLNAASYEAERSRAEALAELDRAKTDFFSNVSHEFRTPLTLIAGPVEELRSAPAVAADPRLREEVDVVARNALRLGKLVNTLLDFSRLQAGRLRARFEPVDLAAFTAELASVFRSTVTRAGLDFTVDCPPLGTPVHVDRELWEQVVLNLLSNAVKFTLDGGITVRLRREGNAAVLTVADTGTGIPATELPRLFERFHRIRDARARSGEGSGIGLAMVRELVTLHGGTVTAESTPDVGTTFTVTLPVGTAHLPADQVADDDPTAPIAPAVSPAARPFVAEALRWLPGEPEPAVAEATPGTSANGPAPGTGPFGGRVLVADDNADMREYLVRLLSDRYAVEAVADGQEALDRALAEPPDLVVSDIMMPRLDGLQLLAALREDARTARTPVVLLSARAGQDAAVEGLAAGADDYLVKPFPAQELLARVGAHLHLGRARREAEARFTAMADLAPALIWVSDAEGRRVFVNAGWTAFTGRPAGEAQGAGWAEGVHPEDRERYRAVVEPARAEQRGWEVEFRLRRADGAWHWLLERAAPIGAGETLAGWVGACTDITARYRETERQTLLAEVGAALDREADLEGQLARLTRLLVDRRLADLCTVRLVGDDGRLRWAGAAALEPAVEAAVDAVDPDVGFGPHVARTGQAVLETDMPRALRERHEPNADDVEQLVLRSGLLVPLRVRGRVTAVLGLGRRAGAPAYNDDDRALVEEIAGRAALAVDNTLLLAEERAGAQRLALLQRVTAELSAATTPEQVAAAAAAHVRQLLGSAAEVGVFELDAAHRALTALTLTGGDDDGRRHFATLPLHAPLPVTTAVNERRAVYVEDGWSPAGDGLRAELAEVVARFGLRSALALPLTAAGRLAGVVGVGFPHPRTTTAVERAMLLAVAEQCAQALDRARLYRAEQGIAETLQRNLLPAELPALDRLALAARYLPGAEGTSAGGDWYDVVPLDGDAVAVAVGDVVGQGPAAAAVMGQLRSALSAALLAGHGPAAALELLDRFASRLPGALASTAACVVLDPDAGTVRWARAGHLPPLLVTADGARLLDDPAGVVLGVPGRPAYTEGSAALGPGDTLLLYTDGLVERRGEDLDAGLGRLCELAGTLAGEDPDRLVTGLLHAMLAETDQPDDVALIAARVLPAPLRLTIPAEPRQLATLRRAVAAWSAAAGLGETTTEDLQLALGEAAANAVEHAYRDGPAGECAVTLDRTPGGGVAVRVTDTGTWRPEPADKGFRGRGLQLIEELGEDVEVRRVPGGTTVTFALRPGAPVRPAPSGPPADLPEGARLATGQDDGVLRLTLSGDLDLAGTEALGPALLGHLAAAAPGSRVELDLRPTTYLASSGVALLLRARAEAAGGGLELALLTRPDGLVARVLQLSGLAPVPAG